MSLLGRINNPEKLAGIIARYLTFLNVLIIVLIVLSVVSCVRIVMGSDISIWEPEMNPVLSLGNGIRYLVDAPVVDGGSKSLSRDLATIVGLIIFEVVVLVVIRSSRAVLRSVAEKRPFDQENPKRIRNIAVVVIVSGFLSPWLTYFLTRHELKLYNLEVFSIRYRPDGNSISLGLLLLVLAGVFAYGCQLQQEIGKTI